MHVSKYIDYLLPANVVQDDSIMDNMITFLVAGHETTSGMLSFVFYYLLKNARAYESAQKEVDQVIGRDPITVDHLSKLPYLNAVLRETLRLSPSAPATGIEAKEDTVLGGKYAIKAGVPIVCLYPMVSFTRKEPPSASLTFLSIVRSIVIHLCMERMPKNFDLKECLMSLSTAGTRSSPIVGNLLATG